MRCKFCFNCSLSLSLSFCSLSFFFSLSPSPVRCAVGGRNYLSGNKPVSDHVNVCRVHSQVISLNFEKAFTCTVHFVSHYIRLTNMHTHIQTTNIVQEIEIERERERERKKESEGEEGRV